MYYEAESKYLFHQVSALHISCQIIKQVNNTHILIALQESLFTPQLCVVFRNNPI